LIEFRGNTDYGTKLYNKNVILVDDGIATGSTILASALWIKNNHSCKSLVVSSPVAPKDNNNIIDNLNKIADKVTILYVSQDFSGVGQFYKNFNQIEDQQVKEIMKKYVIISNHKSFKIITLNQLCINVRYLPICKLFYYVKFILIMLAYFKNIINEYNICNI